MAFFDDLSRKITSVGQTTVQKAKDMTDIARINSLISEEEKRVNNYYFQIGKLYVAKHVNDFEADFETMVTSIKESEEKIKNYQQQIQQTKGMIRCEACGELVSNNIAFCSSCGAKMPKYQADDKIGKCPYCNSMVLKSMRFCTICGKTLGETVTAPSAQPAEVKENPEPAQATALCPYCGAENDGDNGFCSQCGKLLKNTANPSAMEDISSNTTQEVLICKVCGAELEDGTVFCTECGTKV